MLLMDTELRDFLTAVAINLIRLAANMGYDETADDMREAFAQLRTSEPSKKPDYDKAWDLYYVVADRRHRDGLTFTQICAVVDAALRKEEE